MEEPKRIPGEEPKKAPNNFAVVGINIGVFALYSLIGALTQGSILSAFPVFVIHIIVCFIVAIVLRQAVWALTAGLLLLIGLSTCVAAVVRS